MGMKCFSTPPHRGLLLVLALHTLTGVQSEHCTSSQLAECFEFRNDLLNITTGASPLQTLSDDLLDEYCSLFHRVTQACLEDMTTHCNSETAGRLEGYIAATSFLCEDDLADFLSVKACLGTPDTHRQLSICAEQYRLETGNIGALDKDADQKYCRTTEELIDCESDALENTCSSEAGQWTRTYNTKYYSGYLAALECHPASTTLTPPTGLEVWVIAVIAVGSLVVLTTLITVIVCLVRKSNSKHSGNSTARPQSPAVTVIVDNRHLDPPKNYHRQHSNGSHHSHNKHSHNAPHHHHHHPRRLPRSDSSETQSTMPSVPRHGEENTYTHLDYKHEDVRYHGDPTAHDHVHTPAGHMIMTSQGKAPAAGGVNNKGFDPVKADVEDDYLHPVESHSEYEELPPTLK